ncbi:MAG: phospholipase D family protein [Candidatus Dasytiphilus stammeri]
MNIIIKKSIILFFLLVGFTSSSLINIKVGFSPDISASKLILQSISQAHRKIDIAAYSFTSKPISLALLAVQKRGVIIRIIADHKANNRYTALTFLANHGISIRLNNNYAIMHHKFMIIDNQIVQTGSYNYTRAAAKQNAENIIVLYNAPYIALQYEKEFKRLWEESSVLQPQY